MDHIYLKMRQNILVDECTGPNVAAWFRDNDYEVFSVFEDARGMVDNDIIEKAVEENWIW